MSAFEQLELLRQIASKTYCPNLLMAINKRANELENEIKQIKTLEVIICKN